MKSNVLKKAKEIAIPNPRPKTMAIKYPSTVSRAVTPV